MPACRPGRTALPSVDRHLHQLADADLVELRERIVLEDLRVVVGAEELAGVVAGEAEGHLGQVVRAEAEEVRFLRDLVRGKSRSRDLDHGTDFVLQVSAGSSDFGIRSLNHELLDVLEFLDFADKRDHDLRLDGPVRMSLLDVDGGTDDSLGLHLRDLRIGDGQTAASVSHHRVELVQGSNHRLDVLNALALCVSELLDVGFLGGNELMKRRIQETNRNRVAFKSLIESLEVALLIGQDLRQSLFAGLGGVGADHLAERGDSLGLEEHVLGTAEADTLGAQLAGLLRVLRSVGVGADLHGAVLVRPAHDAAELAGDGSVHGGDQTVVDVAGGAVDGDEVAPRGSPCRPG